MSTDAVGTSRTRSCRASWLLRFVALALFGTLAVGPVTGQIATVTFTEWDLPGGAAGTSPGALFISDQIIAGTGDVWYVTRGYPTLIKFTPTTPIGTWQRWPLEPVGTSGGLKVTRRGVAFVQLADEVVRIDTVSNTRTRWFGASRGLSDLALDGSGNIYTTSPVARAVGYVQRLTPVGASDATMTRWYVGQGVGDVYLSGVAVHPSTGRVYYSEPTRDQIGELDPRTNMVRKWPLIFVGATLPGQISIDPVGDVWAVAGSGHLVRLRVSSNELTSFAIPTPASSPVGIAASALIGFTESATMRIGALLPNGSPVVVAPSSGLHNPEHFAVIGEVDRPEPVSGTAGAVIIVMQAVKVGPFIEAQLPAGSASPLGIDNTSTPGGFFYTVGESASLNRVGAVVFPAP